MDRFSAVNPLPHRNGCDSYDLIKTLGRGTYGHCYKVQCKKTGEVLVMKAVSLQGLSEKDRRDTLEEAQLMQEISHNNIIRHVDSWCQNEWLFIVMEYAQEGDLGQAIASFLPSKPSIPEETLLGYIADIANGLKYLHDRRILHRDLKPSNIFMVGSKAVIADLGLGRRLNSSAACATSKVGTPLYFSPELCQEQPYDEKSDIWAFGCLIHELATGDPPFTAANQVALARKVVTEALPRLPPPYSADLAALVQAMLAKDPTVRISIDDVIKYPMIAKCLKRLAAERSKASKDSQTVESWSAAAMQQEFEIRIRNVVEAMEVEYMARLSAAQQQVESEILRVKESDAARWSAQERQLQESVVHLQAESSALKEKCVTLERASQLVSNRLRDAENSYEQMKSVQLQLEAALHEVSRELVRSEASVVFLQDQLKSEIDARAQLEQQFDILLDRVQSLDALQWRLSDLEAENSSLQETQTRMEEQLTKLRNGSLQHDSVCAPERQQAARDTVGAQQSTLPPIAHNTSVSLDVADISGNATPSPRCSLAASPHGVDVGENIYGGSGHKVESCSCHEESSMCMELPVSSTYSGIAQISKQQSLINSEPKDAFGKPSGGSDNGSTLHEAEPQAPHAEISCYKDIPAAYEDDQHTNSLGSAISREQEPVHKKASSKASRSPHRVRNNDLFEVSMLEDMLPMPIHLESAFTDLAAPSSSKYKRPFSPDSVSDGRSASPRWQSSPESSIGIPIPYAFESVCPAPGGNSKETEAADPDLTESGYEDINNSTASYGFGSPRENTNTTIQSIDGSFDAVIVGGQIMDGKEHLEAPSPPHHSGLPESGVEELASNGSFQSAKRSSVVDMSSKPLTTRDMPQRNAAASSKAWHQSPGGVGSKASRIMSEALSTIAAAAEEASQEGLMSEKFVGSSKLPEREKAAEELTIAGSKDLTSTGRQPGANKGRLISLSQLGILPATEQSGATTATGVNLHVLLAWHRAVGSGPSNKAQPRLRSTVLQPVWGNKERYRLHGGADSGVVILFRSTATAASRGSSIRKVMARRGCRPDFVRLELKPFMEEDGGEGKIHLSWQAILATAPCSTEDRRGVSSTNTAAALIEIIVEFSNPNPVEELLIAKVDARLQEVLSSAGAQCGTHDDAIPSTVPNNASLKRQHYAPTRASAETAAPYLSRHGSRQSRPAVEGTAGPLSSSQVSALLDRLERQKLSSLQGSASQSIWDAVTARDEAASFQPIGTNANGAVQEVMVPRMTAALDAGVAQHEVSVCEIAAHSNNGRQEERIFHELEGWDEEDEDDAPADAILRGVATISAVFRRSSRLIKAVERMGDGEEERIDVGWAPLLGRDGSVDEQQRSALDSQALRQRQPLTPMNWGGADGVPRGLGSVRPETATAKFARRATDEAPTMRITAAAEVERADLRSSFEPTQLCIEASERQARLFEAIRRLGSTAERRGRLAFKPVDNACDGRPRTPVRRRSSTPSRHHRRGSS